MTTGASVTGCREVPGQARDDKKGLEMTKKELALGQFLMLSPPAQGSSLMFL